MEPQDFYRSCLSQATDVIKQVQSEQLTNETPDDEWSVRDLINHMIYEVSWVPDMVAGRTMAQVGDTYEGDLVAAENDDVDTAWDLAANRAEQATTNCDPNEIAHLSYADVPAGDYLQMTGGDVLVHAWDLAKAIGVTFEFDHEVAEQLWSGVKDNNMPGSLFKSALPYEEADSYQDKILAKFGRNKDWSSNG